MRENIKILSFNKIYRQQLNIHKEIVLLQLLFLLILSLWKINGDNKDMFETVYL